MLLPDAQKHFAKLLTAACVRRGHLETLHTGITPISLTGDYSDVKVIDAEGREIPWNSVSRIRQDEMKSLMVGVVNRIYTFLARTLFTKVADPAFEHALERVVSASVTSWEEPRYLDDFLMPLVPSEAHS